MDEKDIAAYISEKVIAARKIHKESYVPAVMSTEYAMGWYRKSLQTSVQETGVGPALRELILLLAEDRACEVDAWLQEAQTHAKGG